MAYLPWRRDEPWLASAAESWLRRLLGMFGGLGLLAIIPAAMPRSWLGAAVQWAEPGTPVQLLVEYLARALSAMCVLLGGLLCISAADIRRYRPMIWWMALFLVVAGSAECLLLGLAPYPKNLVWTLLMVDGGIIALFGLAVVGLLSKVPQQPSSNQQQIRKNS